ncbi:MAG: EF-hand domain-containing protein [Pseudomonadota bacterium]
MNTISNVMGFDPSQFNQQSTERFKTADLDGNKQVSKDEFLQVVSANGIDASRMETTFNRIDANGDGSISQQEHQQMMQKAQDRISNMMAKADSGEDGFDAVLSFMESLSDDAVEPSERQRLDDVLERLKSGDKSEAALSEGVPLISNLLPQIDTQA